MCFIKSLQSLAASFLPLQVGICNTGNQKHFPLPFIFFAYFQFPFLAFGLKDLRFILKQTILSQLAISLVFSQLLFPMLSREDALI